MSPELERVRQEHLDLLCDMHNALCRLGGMMSLAKQGVFPTADWREFEPKLKALITKSNLQDPDKLERLVREDQDKISREDERAKLKPFLNKQVLDERVRQTIDRFLQESRGGVRLLVPHLIQRCGRWQFSAIALCSTDAPTICAWF